MSERLPIIRTVLQAKSVSKEELSPCRDCVHDPGDCGGQFVSGIVGRGPSVFCVSHGMIEMVDLSAEDQVSKIALPRGNGQLRPNRTPSVQSAPAV